MEGHIPQDNILVVFSSMLSSSGGAQDLCGEGRLDFLCMSYAAPVVLRWYLLLQEWLWFDGRGTFPKTVFCSCHFSQPSTQCFFRGGMLKLYWGGMLGGSAWGG
jgi:hypothetical protein